MFGFSLQRSVKAVKITQFLLFSTEIDFFSGI